LLLVVSESGLVLVDAYYEAMLQDPAEPLYRLDSSGRVERPGFADRFDRRYRRRGGGTHSLVLTEADTVDVFGSTERRHAGLLLDVLV
jgi:hypothetical protein